MRNKTRARAAGGFTLIEVMLALLISSFVMMVMIEVFTAQQKMYFQQTALTRAQANARASLAILSREIRMAGYTGLPLGMGHLNSNNAGSGPGSLYAIMSLTNDGTAISSGTNTLLTSSKVIAGKVALVSSAIAPGGATKPDSFEIFANFARGMGGLNNTLSEGATVTQIKVPAANHELFQNSGFNRPAFVIVGNNDRAEIFTFVSSPTSAPTSGDYILTVQGTAKNEFKANSEVGGAANVVLPIFRRVYFVDTKNVLDMNGNVTGTLFVANYDAAGNLEGNSVELVQDVQDFQVNYDVRDSNNWTVTQNLTQDPCMVNGVRILISNKGWEPNAKDKSPAINRELISVVRIRNASLGQASCPMW